MEEFNLVWMSFNLLEYVDFVIIVLLKPLQTTKKLKQADKNKPKNIHNYKYYDHQDVKCLN